MLSGAETRGNGMMSAQEKTFKREVHTYAGTPLEEKDITTSAKELEFVISQNGKLTPA